MPRKPLFSRNEILFLTLPLLLVGLFRLFPNSLVNNQAGITVLHLLGRTGNCSYTQAVDSWKSSRATDEVTKKIFEASSKVEETPDGLARWRTPQGDFWGPKETTLFWAIAEQETDFYGAGTRAVRKGDIVLDCGANLGTFTRKALNAGAAKVIAIEPSPVNVACLRRTFAKEVEEGRVVVYPKGVWHEDGSLTFHVYPNSTLDSLVMAERSDSREKPKQIQVPVTTIDKLAAELGLNHIDFIKMDIEGAERNAIQGAAAVLRRDKPRMSIATENLKDDQTVAPALVKQLNPAYRAECGGCAAANIYEIRPSVYFFD